MGAIHKGKGSLLNMSRYDRPGSQVLPKQVSLPWFFTEKELEALQVCWNRVMRISESSVYGNRMTQRCKRE